MPDLGSGAPGVQVRPLLSAPRTGCESVQSVFLLFMAASDFLKDLKREEGIKMKRKITLAYTAKQASEEFYRHSEVKGLAEATLKGYRNYVDNFVGWFGADISVEEITTSVLEVYMMFKREQRVKPVSVAFHGLGFGWTSVSAAMLATSLIADKVKKDYKKTAALIAAVFYVSECLFDLISFSSFFISQ